MSDNDPLHEPQETASVPAGDDVLRMLAETADAIDQLSQNVAAWHEHHAALQENLQALMNRMTQPASGEQLSDEDLKQALTNLIQMLEQHLGTVDLEHRFSALEHQVDRLHKDMKTSQSDLTYIKEKMQVSYGILITVPALLMAGILLWFWLS